MQRQDLDMLRELMLEHMKASSAMQSDVQEIKTDLKHYVHKTEALQQQTKELQGQVQMARGSIALFGFLAVLASLWKSFKGPQSIQRMSLTP